MRGEYGVSSLCLHPMLTLARTLEWGCSAKSGLGSFRTLAVPVLPCHCRGIGGFDAKPHFSVQALGNLSILRGIYVAPLFHIPPILTSANTLKWGLATKPGLGSFCTIRHRRGALPGRSVTDEASIPQRRPDRPDPGDPDDRSSRSPHRRPETIPMDDEAVAGPIARPRRIHRPNCQGAQWRQSASLKHATRSGQCK